MSKKIGLLLGALLLIIAFSVYRSGHIYYPIFLDGEITIVERVFRDTYEGDIIGNPNFEPSFDEVNSDNFLQKLEASSESLGYQFNISQPHESENTGFLYEIAINETFTIKYSEGFMILSFTHYNENQESFRQLIQTIMITLEKDIDRNEVELFFNETQNISFIEYNNHFISGMIDYRYYEGNGYENGYEVHIEDMKMGH